MDSKEVNRAIRAKIRPMLKGQGFTVFTPRTSWRHFKDRIELIRFWSPYNWMQAEVLNITTFSFHVDVGIFFLYIPPTKGQIKEKKWRLLPTEPECHLRMRLIKGINQPETSGDNLWYVDPNGANLAEVMKDVRQSIAVQALPELERFADKENVLEFLLEEKIDGKNPSFYCGAINSPNRNYLTGYTALRVGEFNVALEMLEKVYASYIYNHLVDQLEADIALIQQKVS